MGNKNVQDYIDKGLSGAPQLRPEEKNIYLGNYRERVIFTVNKSELKRMIAFNLLEKEMKLYPDGHLFIHSQIASSFLTKCMEDSKSCNYQFTIVTKENPPSDDTICIVLASSKAINLENVSLTTKYPPAKEKTVPEKKGFFSKLFRN